MSNKFIEFGVTWSKIGKQKFKVKSMIEICITRIKFNKRSYFYL